MLSSDHSPSAPELKLFDEGDFLRAWGGISSLQFVLPVTWSYGLKHGISLHQLVSWWSERPAKLAGLHLKVNILSPKYANKLLSFGFKNSILYKLHYYCRGPLQLEIMQISSSGILKWNLSSMMITPYTLSIGYNDVKFSPFQ